MLNLFWSVKYLFKNSVIKYLFIGVVISSQISTPLLAQEKIKTVENVGNLKRRELTLDDNLNLVQELYFSKGTQKIIVSIEYNGSNSINLVTGYINYPEIAYKIDFINGYYFDKELGIELKFKDNFIFHGEQKGKNLVINYSNGYKNGVMVQADSVTVGKKTVAYDKIDTRYLKYDILRFSKSLGEEPVYKIYKGLILNFKDGRLEGNQKSFYGNSSVKFDAEFISNRLISYNSYDANSLYISKLKTNNGLSYGSQLLNGNILDRDTSYLFWHPELIKAGDIVYFSSPYARVGSNYESDQKYLYSANGYGSLDIRKFMGIESYQRDKAYQLEFKERFDNEKGLFTNPYVIKCLLNIPDFRILNYEFVQEEDKSIVALKIHRNNLDTSNIFAQQSLYFRDSFFYNYSKHNYEVLGPEYGPQTILLHNFGHKPGEYNDISLKDISNLNYKNNNLALWLIDSYGVTNFFILKLNIDKDGNYRNRYIFDSASLNRFFVVFIDRMFFNIKKFDTESQLKRDFSQYLNPYTEFGESRYYIRYFDFITFGVNVWLGNLDMKRYFLIKNQYELDYFDGKCLYQFTFKKTGGFGIELINKECF